MKTRFLMIALIAILGFNCAGPASDQNEGTETEGVSQSEDQQMAAETTEMTMEVLNPNLASAEELSALPYMTDELVKAIMEGRPFLKMSDFHDLLVASIDEANLEGLYEKCFVPMNLNTTPEDQFKLVPGVGDKMAHEFEEYRPYKKVAQFRREMSKYVDDVEIARYEHYVFVPVSLNEGTDEEILAIPGVGDRMLREFKEYRPYKDIEQFRREIGKYVDEGEVARLERWVTL